MMPELRWLGLEWPCSHIGISNGICIRPMESPSLCHSMSLGISRNILEISLESCVAARFSLGYFRRYDFELEILLKEQQREFGGSYVVMVIVSIAKVPDIS